MRNALLTAFLCLISAAAIGAEGDWGYAHNFYIKKSLSERWSVLSRSQFALRDDMSDLFFGFADVGLGYGFYPGWRFDAVYRLAWLQPAEDWLEERRPLVNLNWFGSLGDTRVSNRSRLEFRFYDYDKDDDIRFRNETRVEFPWAVLPFEIRPYFEEEFFYGRNSGEIEMNWLTGGLYYKPSKKVKLKVGYRWIAIRVREQWENRNQLVTGLNLFF
jgi:hypothetical protein